VSVNVDVNVTELWVKSLVVWLPVVKNV